MSAHVRLESAAAMTTPGPESLHGGSSVVSGGRRPCVFPRSVPTLCEFPPGIKVSKILPPVCDYEASEGMSASQVVPVAPGLDLFPTLLVWRRLAAVKRWPGAVRSSNALHISPCVCVYDRVGKSVCPVPLHTRASHP